jgi:hypothetical protein
MNLIEINLERHLFLDDIFKTLDIDTALREIEALGGIPVSAPDTLLFLDEIQSTSHAIQLLRYFFEEKKNLPVIAAGSLLEFTLSDHSFPMPGRKNMVRYRIHAGCSRYSPLNRRNLSG